MDNFEKDIFEISFSEVEEYANLIFEMKITKFIFYQNSKDELGRIRKLSITHLNHNTIYFQIWDWEMEDQKVNEKAIYDDFYECFSNSVKRKRNNNIFNIIDYCSSAKIKSEEKVRLWCLELIAQIKPAKKE